MKRKLEKLFLTIVGGVLLIVSVRDFSIWRSISEIITALLMLVVAMCLESTDETGNISKSNYVIDHKVTLYTERMLLIAFLVFMIFYYIDKKNILLGILSLYSFIIWQIQQLMIIILGFIKYK
ncbi:hypothetical protein OZY43_06690 [Lactobacillus sp. ESL0785]|uniref:hypothetical protein n=1 Tax=Lactobacillus sp. ESL0785 TaxID=2983232 RepID=UPI0023F62913|nr:hypothetical protein [Lactobacillus sp. ESL0785]WEV70620.1 hypothetical protein OZY43_06690 [Lactobacillus sp. ESL0785]